MLYIKIYINILLIVHFLLWILTYSSHFTELRSSVQNPAICSPC